MSNTQELRNEKCFIEYNEEKKTIFGRDLTDRYNEPSFYNQTRRSIKKAWMALSDEFKPTTTMDQAQNIVDQYIRTRYYCAMD